MVNTLGIVPFLGADEDIKVKTVAMTLRMLFDLGHIALRLHIYIFSLILLWFVDSFQVN